MRKLLIVILCAFMLSSCNATSDDTDADTGPASLPGKILSEVAWGDSYHSARLKFKDILKSEPDEYDNDFYMSVDFESIKWDDWTGEFRIFIDKSSDLSGMHNFQIIVDPPAERVQEIADKIVSQLKKDFGEPVEYDASQLMHAVWETDKAVLSASSYSGELSIKFLSPEYASLLLEKMEQDAP